MNDSMPPSAEEAARTLMSAVLDALDLPSPADPDNRAYLRLRSRRASAAVRNAGMVLAQEHSLPGDYMLAAGALEAQLADLPAEGYGRADGGE